MASLLASVLKTESRASSPGTATRGAVKGEAMPPQLGV